MSNLKIAGYVLFAVGIIGGVEGVIDSKTMPVLGISISAVALIVIVIASYLLERK